MQYGGYMQVPGGQARDRKDHIMEVTGQGSAEANPDTALIQLGIVTESQDVKTAQDENKKRLEKAVNALYRQGIDKGDIQTISYNISPKYSFQDGKQTLEGYEVVNLLSVKTNQLDQIGAIVDTAVNNGINRVDRVQFQLENTQVYLEKALREAVKQGYEKAVVLTQSYQVSLQSVPVKVTEISKGSVPFEREASAFAASASSPSPVFPGSLTVSAEVRVQYRYG
ncbi:SIMPL domain-containing protein [Bacillus sp. FJAT-42376]|uniref:SIMPL domain-containing protein n=1 Tax=Bacillus sp. FJAT-42376 TaxID=2014076 RepID=UPI0013DDC5A1|nr:SIMPL domain-containing protein [Bacillus sp. FJAT-42376]